jgi:flagellar assembly protein FliH
VRIDPAKAEENRAVRERNLLRRQAADEGRAQGIEEGRAIGQEEGRMAALEEGRRMQAEIAEAQRAEVERFAQAMAEFADDAYRSVREWTRQAEERLADLAIEIARRAIFSELQLSRESIIEIVREAVSEAGHTDRIRIRVNPLDAGVLESHRSELEASLGQVRGIEFAPDDAIRAGCLIESEHGQVDARVETFLERLQEAA